MKPKKPVNLTDLLTSMMICIVLASFSQIAVSQKSVKHLDLPDITSFEEAKKVFNETTSQLKEKTELDASTLNDIHLITYSLEKAVAFFARNMQGDQQSSAEEMVEVVELIHIGSENNRAAETRRHLQEYFRLASAYSQGL